MVCAAVAAVMGRDGVFEGWRFSANLVSTTFLLAISFPFLSLLLAL
jgi:hypothetical protein